METNKVKVNTHDIELPPLPPLCIAPSVEPGDYPEVAQALMDYARAAVEAALQSQSNHDTTLFCDLKTDEEKSNFFLSGRGYETGVIAQAIQHDVAMAYHRCAEFKKDLEALLAERDALREALKTMVEMVEMNGFGRAYAMHVARAALAQGQEEE